MTKITIKGVEYQVVFNMKAMMAYEEIRGKSFLGETFDTFKERITLILSAVLAADENTSLTFDTFLAVKGKDEVNEITMAYSTVMGLVGDFFKIPEIEKGKDENANQEHSEADEEEQQKN